MSHLGQWPGGVWHCLEGRGEDLRWHSWSGPGTREHPTDPRVFLHGPSENCRHLRDVARDCSTHQGLGPAAGERFPIGHEVIIVLRIIGRVCREVIEPSTWSHTRGPSRKTRSPVSPNG